MLCKDKWIQINNIINNKLIEIESYIAKIFYIGSLSIEIAEIFCLLRIHFTLFAHTSMRTSAVFTTIILLRVTLKSFQIIGENLRDKRIENRAKSIWPGNDHYSAWPVLDIKVAFAKSKKWK